MKWLMNEVKKCAICKLRESPSHKLYQRKFVLEFMDVPKESGEFVALPCLLRLWVLRKTQNGKRLQKKNLKVVDDDI